MCAGIQFDYSFHQHGPQLLAGSYGAEYSLDILSLMNFVWNAGHNLLRAINSFRSHTGQTLGLEFYIPQPNLELFAHLLLDG